MIRSCTCKAYEIFFADDEYHLIYAGRLPALTYDDFSRCLDTFGQMHWRDLRSKKDEIRPGIRLNVSDTTIGKR